MTAIDDPEVMNALSLADDIVDAGADILTECSYGRDDAVVAKAMLACTILDGMSAVIVLLRSFGQAHADTVIRSMFEALGDLSHLCASSEAGTAYFRRMEMTSAQYQKAQAEDVIKRRIGVPNGALPTAIAKAKAQEAKDIIDRLDKLGVSKLRLTPTVRLDAPGLDDEVTGMYGLLCLDAHHDLISLRKRHLRNGEIVFGDTLDKGSAYVSLSCAAMITVRCFFHFCEFPNVVSIRFPSLLKRMDDLAVKIRDMSQRETDAQVARHGWQADGARTPSPKAF